MQDLEGGAQNAVMMSVRSLRSETDEKVGGPFFSPESIEQAADVAGKPPSPHNKSIHPFNPPSQPAL